MNDSAGFSGKTVTTLHEAIKAEFLKQRKWPEHYWSDLQLEALNEVEVLNRLKRTNGNGVPAVAIPYRDADGNKVLFERVRYQPMNEAHAKKIEGHKYDQPEKSGSHLFFSPLQCSFNLALDTKSAFCVFEGEFDSYEATLAIQADKLEHYVIGIAGVSSWGKGGVLLPELDTSLAGKSVYVCFDADTGTGMKPAPRRALVTFCNALRAKSAEVFVCDVGARGTFGEKYSISEYLADGHSIKELLDNAEHFRLPSIRYDPSALDLCVEQAAQALAAATPPTIYRRGQELVQVTRIPDKIENKKGMELPAGTTIVSKVEAKTMQYALAKVAVWTQMFGQAVKPVTPNEAIALSIIRNPVHWIDMNELVAIADAPIFNELGEIIDTAGYDYATGLLYDGSAPKLEVPDQPTKHDALRAWEDLRKVFSGFAFVQNPGVEIEEGENPRAMGEAVTLAYLLTLLLRPQLDVAPALIVSASTPAEGKGMLVRTCNLIVRGVEPAIASHTASAAGNEDEMRKKLGAFAAQSTSSVMFDNLSFAVGGDALNSFLTSPKVSDRTLGKSEAPTLHNKLSIAFTGNNLTAKADCVRRVLFVFLSSGEERPEKRVFEMGDPTTHAIKHRARLLSCLFIILKAYHFAPSAKSKRVVLGSFDKWATRVAEVVLWLTGINPVDSQKVLQEEDEEEVTLRAFINEWYLVTKLKPVTAAELIALSANFGDILVNKVSMNRDGVPVALSLSKYVDKNMSRTTGGFRIMKVKGRTKDKHFMLKTIKN